MSHLAALALAALLIQPAASLDAVRSRANDLILADKPLEAAAVLERALRTHPDVADLHLALGTALLYAADAVPDARRTATTFRARLERAETHLQRAWDLDPDARQLVALRFITLYDETHLARPAAAEPHIRAMLAFAPEQALHHVMLARVLVAQKKYTPAADALVAAAQQVGTTWQEFFATTAGDLVLKTPEMPVDDQRRVLQRLEGLAATVIARKDDDLRGALMARGVALQLLHERTARDDRERAALKARSDAAADAFFAFTRAEREADAGAAVPEPPSTEALMQQAIAAIDADVAAGRRAQAQQAIAEGATRWGTHAEWWALVAAVHDDLGEDARALAAIEQARALEPENPQRPLMLARYWMKKATQADTPAATRRQHLQEALRAADAALLLKSRLLDAHMFRRACLSQLVTLEADPARKKARQAEITAADARIAKLRAEQPRP